MSTAGIFKRPAFTIYHIAWCAVDWLFPPRCGGCNRPGVRWCETCRGNAEKILPPFCPHCGDPLETPGTCLQCQNDPPHFTAARSWAVFRGRLRQALHRLKYYQDKGLGEALASELIYLLQEQNWHIGLVAPVPLGRQRLSERGYNQADLLARPLALACGLKYTPRAVQRMRETRSQVGLSLQERMHNVAGAFSADPQIVEGKTLLLVDDVTTTGATLNACSLAALQAGAAAVYAITLARAAQPGQDDPPDLSELP